jgi:hypothetical protein
LPIIAWMENTLEEINNIRVNAIASRTSTRLCTNYSADWLFNYLKKLFQLPRLYSIKWYGKIISNGVWLRIWKKVAAAYFKVLCQHCMSCVSIAFLNRFSSIYTAKEWRETAYESKEMYMNPVTFIATNDIARGMIPHI